MLATPLYAVCHANTDQGTFLVLGFAEGTPYVLAYGDHKGAVRKPGLWNQEELGGLSYFSTYPEAEAVRQKYRTAAAKMTENLLTGAELCLEEAAQ